MRAQIYCVIPAKAGIQFSATMTAATAKRFYVYILASARNGTLYTGVTSNLIRRVWEHRQKATPGFTSKYGVSRLVYFADFETAEAAITAEKRIKKWNRAWKLALIEQENPNWDDLYDQISS